jgi:hypothetical protein
MAARLTDTQLVILSSASRRNDRGVDLPTNVTGEILGWWWFLAWLIWHVI